MVYNVDKIIEYQIRKRYRNAPIPYEDLFQIGYESYLRAYQRAGEGLTLAYLQNAIIWDINRALRTERRHSNRVVYVENPEAEDEHEPNSTTDKKILRLEALIGLLPNPHKKVLRGIYLSKNPKSLKEMAKELGLGLTRTGQIKSEAIDMLKKMEAMDEDTFL